MIDLRYVKKLIDMIDASSVDSIEITSDKGMKIRISKSPQQRGAVQVTTPMPAMMPAPMRMTPAAGIPMVGEDSGDAVPTKPEPAKPAALEVKSPMVGTFYKS